jgi:hypothetical protein
MKPFSRLLSLCVAASLVVIAIRDVSAGTPPPHNWDPNRAVNPPYGLDDIDGFSLGDYEYCRWGNMQDSGTATSMDLDFTKLSTGTTQNELEAEHYLQNATQIIPFSSLISRTWTPATGNLGGHVAVVQSSAQPLYLFRKLHFSNTLETKFFSTPLPQDAEKVIVLIHGWNPESHAYSYGDEFDALYNALTAATAGTEWKLVLYHWEEDADTGYSPLLQFFEGTNARDATETASISHLHGQHLGQLLASFGHLRRVHFISHSAGAWAARSATRSKCKSACWTPLFPVKQVLRVC